MPRPLTTSHKNLHEKQQHLDSRSVQLLADITISIFQWLKNRSITRSKPIRCVSWQLYSFNSICNSHLNQLHEIVRIMIIINQHLWFQYWVGRFAHTRVLLFLAASSPLMTHFMLLQGESSQGQTHGVPVEFSLLLFIWRDISSSGI